MAPAVRAASGADPAVGGSPPLFARRNTAPTRWGLVLVGSVCVGLQTGNNGVCAVQQAVGAAPPKIR